MAAHPEQMRLYLALAATAILCAGGAPLTAQADEIGRAVLPLPESERAAATVMTLRDGAWTVAREGAGEFVCLADDPSDDRFQAACYHRSLEPYMARGRELRAQGVAGRESIQRRWTEIEAGTLEMPAHAALHQLLAEAGWDGDPATARRLTVIYVPFATAAELGLPADGSTGGPWLMFPGRPTAHIMIPG